MRITSRSGRLAGAAALFAAALLSGCGSTVQYKPQGGPSLFQPMSAPGAQVDAAAAVSVISEYRRANGLGPVTLDPTLMRMAAEQARVMAAKDKLSHTVDGTLAERAQRAGYRFARLAENVGAGHETLADAFGGWRDSSGHRANMLMKDATRMGIAVAQAPHSHFKVFWSMIIGAPEPVRTAGPAPGSYRWGPELQPGGLVPKL